MLLKINYINKKLSFTKIEPKWDFFLLLFFRPFERHKRENKAQIQNLSKKLSEEATDLSKKRYFGEVNAWSTSVHNQSTAVHDRSVEKERVKRKVTIVILFVCVCLGWSLLVMVY